MLMSAIYLIISLLFCAHAYAADRLVECEPQRVHDNRYWSFRIIDGRACWYAGRPGKPKAELRWSRPLPSEREQISEAVQPERVVVTPTPLGAVPAQEEEKLTPEALTTIGVQRLLETKPDENNFGPMTRSVERIPPPLLPPKQRERLPIWMLVAFVIATVGVAALLPIMRSLRNG
jgi:hypothetical protein